MGKKQSRIKNIEMLKKKKGKSDNARQSKAINREFLIKCTYDIKDYNAVQIINGRYQNYLNKDLEDKIKIWNNNKKENLSHIKRFDKLGLNVIYFIVEEKLKNLSFIFTDCSSLKHIQFINPQTEEVIAMCGMFDQRNEGNV